MIWLARRLNAAHWLADTPLARVYMLTPRTFDATGPAPSMGGRSTTTPAQSWYELNTAITTIREKHGPPPIDDGVPGEPDTPYPAIRAIVLTPSPHHEGAHRGEARPE